MSPILLTLCLLADPASEEAADWDTILESRRQIWSLQSVENHEPPAVNDASWSDGPVDRFVLARLEEAGLEPAARADRRALIRRLTIGLIGLPPSAEEIARFVSDESPDAYQRLVDRLLASPHFGERWARHWMDVARFGETHGHEWNFEVRGAWRYRDYLIRAFNEDVPYDQLILEHLAGDLLPRPRHNYDDQINESLIGTTFYRFGEAGHDDCLEFRELSLDVVDDQINTISKAFQAMTVACARCHDHKLDPVSMRDYYALNGILSSTRYVTRTIDLPNANYGPLKSLRYLKSEIRSELQSLWLKEATEASRYLRAAHSRRKKDPESDQRSKGLDAKRLSHWMEALAVFDPKEGDKKDEEKDGDKKEKDENEKLKALTPTIEHPLYVWHTLIGDPQSKPDELATLWRELAERFEKERRERKAFNAENFVSFGDFHSGDLTPWHAEGLGIHRGAAPSGGFAVAWEGDRVVESALPRGLFTNRLSNRLNGALRSPFLPKDKKYLSLEVAGSNSVVRTVFDNCHLGVKHVDVDNTESRWVKLATQSHYAESNVYAEVVTKLDYQCYPEMNAGKRIGPTDHRSSFGISRAVFHDCDETPRDELDHMTQLFSPTEAVTSTDALLDRYAAAIQESVENWANSRTSEADVRWVNWLLKHRLLTNSIDATSRLSKLVAAYRDVDGKIPSPKIIFGVADLDDGFDAPIRERGDPFTLGDPVKRRYVEVLVGTEKTIDGPRSGRLDIARDIASAENPLTARVMVNRLWHHVFGVGIVRSTDDFGSIGERPSHPKLLDYLAGRFVDVDRWSIKKAIRSLVGSRTFQMSSVVSDVAEETDPANQLLHHYPLRRLEAEVIRDAILAVSGRLDRTFYGESVDPYRFEERKHRRLFRGPLDGSGRRSVYTKMTLTEEPPFLATFNQPEPKETRGRRDVTSVPAQALSLLNDPFVNQQADVWGERLVSDGADSISSRVDNMFLVAFGRPPERHEAEQFAGFVQKLASLHSVPTDEVLGSPTIWRDAAHAVFNMKEFIYTR